MTPAPRRVSGQEPYNGSFHKCPGGSLCPEDRWSGPLAPTRALAQNPRTKVTPEPDTCRLGVRLPASAFLHGADICTPTLPLGALLGSLLGEMRFGRGDTNSETLSPIRGSRWVPVSGKAGVSPARPSGD